MMANRNREARFVIAALAGGGFDEPDGAMTVGQP
jgi:hypothetical protein